MTSGTRLPARHRAIQPLMISALALVVCGICLYTSLSASSATKTHSGTYAESQLSQFLASIEDRLHDHQNPQHSLQHSRCLIQRPKRWYSENYDSDIPLILTDETIIHDLDQPLRDPPFGLDRVESYRLQRLLTVTLQQPPGTTADKVGEVRRRSSGDSSNPGRCAVIGNAGSLQGSALGEEIDDHDYVIRMNSAMTSGFEADVGSKTNLTLFNPDVDIPMEDSHNPFLFWTVKPTGYNWLERAYIEAGMLPSFKDMHSDPIPHWIGLREGAEAPGQGAGVAMLHPAFVRYVHEKWNKGRGDRPSTGQLAIAYGMHICEPPIAVYGFDRTADMYSNQYHMLEDRSDLHDWDFEVEVRDCLEHLGKIKFKYK